MNRLEKIEQLDLCRQTTRYDSFKARSCVPEPTERECQHIKEAQTVLESLGIQQQLEEIRDTVWKMGSIESGPFETSGLIKHGAKIALVASWPVFQRARVIQHFASKNKHAHDEEISPPNVGLKTKVINVSAGDYLSRYLNDKGKSAYQTVYRININQKAIDMDDSKIDEVYQRVRNKIDIELTEVCLTTCHGRPLTEMAAIDRSDLIERIRQGEIAPENVTEEFKEYQKIFGW